MSEMKKCQYCGAMLVADAEVCGMCGSPTAPPPSPTYTGPEPQAVEAIPPTRPEIIEPEIVEPKVIPPPAPQYQAPEPVFSTPGSTQEPSNRVLAVAVEIAAGIFGFLGIGWMIAGKLGLGIGLLVGYWIFIAIYAVILTALSPFTAGFSFFGLCCLPVVPVVSGLMLNNQMK